MNSCRPPEALAAYQEGTLPALALEATERHLLACKPCRDALRVLGEVRECGPGALPSTVLVQLGSLPRRRRLPALRMAAAAALLLAAVLGWALREHPGNPISPPSTVPGTGRSSGGFPSGLLEALEAPLACLTRGAELVLQRGARVTASGRLLRGEKGTFWVEAQGSEPMTPITVDLPGVVLTLRQGAVAVSLREPPRAAWSGWVAEAMAEEVPTAEIWVLRGAIAFQAGDANGRLGLGGKLARGPGGWHQAAGSEADLAILDKARALAAASAPGRELAPAGLRLSGERGWTGSASDTPGAYRWVTVVAGRGASTELGLGFPVEGAWYQWVTGLGRLPAAPEEVVEVVWDGERLTGRVNGVPRFSADREHLKDFLESAPRPGWGISVWGGLVTVSRSVLQQGEAP